LSTIQEILQKGRILLKNLPQPEIEARVLLQKATLLPEEVIYAWPQKKLTRRQERQFYKLVSRRRSGFPLAYLTGEKEFWSIPFRIAPGVFIPRPETELIVEKTIELSCGGEEIIVDVGTGCGNIAISLAKEIPQAKVFASDTSQKALKLARINAQIQEITSIHFVRGSLYAPLKKLGLKNKCDFIVSNPPYVSKEEWERLSPQIKNYEPEAAIVAGETGLEFIQKLIRGEAGSTPLPPGTGGSGVVYNTAWYKNGTSR